MAKPFQPFEPHGRGGPRIGEIPMRLLVPNFVTVLAICAGLSGYGSPSKAASRRR
jgi:CDP-diacylglycerol--serine O-phosphatidyltransferase